jgi:hypothetical protein
VGAQRPLSSAWLRGPRLVLVATVALDLMVLGVLFSGGVGEESLRRVIRWTARTSLLLFLAAFLASALRRRWPGGFTRWLAQNRRYVGLSFAWSHLLHLLAILALARWAPQAFADVPAVTLVFGGGGFVVVALLAVTSNDAAVAWLGHARWSRLHRAGLYYLWFIFAFTYLGQSPLLAAALAGALVLRLRG